MVGIRLIIIMALVGGFIAYLADKMGSKIGKKRLSVFGLRPKHTSVLLTVLSGTLIAVLTVGVMAIASESARTALFGMDKLQQELKSLTSEKEAAAVALQDAHEKVNEQNKKISDLDARIAESTKEKDALESNVAQLNDKYNQAQIEVASLTEARTQLNDEIADLEKTTENLRQGLVTIREGQVYYRAGEVVFAGIMRSGLKHDENVIQLNWLLQNANEAALQRLGMHQQEDKPLQAIWINKSTIETALQRLDNSKGNMLFRVRTVANIIVGEMAVCDIEMVENEFIYPNGSLLLRESYDLRNSKNVPYESVIMNFLSQINHNAVNAGVLPDPLTGKVGSMDASTVLEATEAMRRAKGHFTLSAYARGDITTAGPVLVRFEVDPLDDVQ